MRIGGAVAIAVVLVGIVLATSATTLRIAPAGPDASPDAAPVGPVVYYEILDAEASRLIERRLDGRSPARIVASRTEVDYGRTWNVDPDGTMALAVISGPDDQKLEAVSIATGAVIWTTRTPMAPLDDAVWSPDGRLVALNVIGSNEVSREALIVDAATGRFNRFTIPEDVAIQGFDPAGGLVLRQHLPAADGVNAGWRFLRLDPAAATISRLTVMPEVGPANGGGEDVDPAAGVGVDAAVDEVGGGSVVRVWPLGGGPPRTLATVASVDRVVIDPTGRGVAISAAERIRFVLFDGRAVDLYTGDDPIADFAWSAGGDYLAVTTDREPRLTVVERATGRSVIVPQHDAVAQLLMLRVVGGVPLPASPLPTAEPLPTPTPAPSGADVEGIAGVVSGWVERTAAHQVVHVQRLVPTEGGGLRVAAEMPAIELGPPAVPDDGGPELRLLPRPASDDVLVWIGAPDRSDAWIWDGSSGLGRAALPPDWPVLASDAAWRPDGLALAASAGRATIEGEFEVLFVVAVLGAGSTTEIPVVGPYDRLEGWWSGTELQVGHGVCTEGCAGRFAYSARLRVRDRRLLEMTTADRSHAPIDTIAYDGPSIVLSIINDDPADDIVVKSPSGAGPENGLEVIGFAADGRSLLVQVPTSTGTDVLLVRDPAGRAVDGRLDDPRPERLATLPGRNLRIEVGAGDAWAIVTDRVEDVRLVRLVDGRSWPVDRDRVLAWLDDVPAGSN